MRIPLCNKAQAEFGLYCEADIVPKTLLYGGKIAAALSRQHPRDLFDVKYMDIPLEEDGTVLIQRKIMAGRSVSKVNGETVLYLYSFSGEDRKQDAQSNGRTLLMQRANVAYAMRITDAGDEIGISNEWVNSHFYLISAAWTAGN